MDKWEDRILCQDESCIGTIGNDGRCRVCGLASGDRPIPQAKAGGAATLDQEMPSADQAGPLVDDVNDENDIIDDANNTALEERWEERILCQDESCTGTIGTDGRCRVCGLSLDAGK